MDKKENKENKEIIFHKNQKKLFPQKNIHKKNIISNFHKYTIDSDNTSIIAIKKINSKKNSKINSEELFRTIKKSSNTNQTKIKNKLRTSFNKISKTHNHKKIIIKIQRKKDISDGIKEDIINFNKVSNSNKIKINKKIIGENNFFPKNKNIKSSTYKKIEINVNDISNMKKISKTYNDKSLEIKNSNCKKAKNFIDKISIYNSDITNRSLGDSPIEINKPRKSEKTDFSQFFERKSNITHIYTNNYFDKLYNERNIEKIEENLYLPNHTNNEKNNNYKTNRTIRKKDNNYKQSFVSLYNKNNNNFNDVENELDKFFNNHKNNKNVNNNELFRFSNISFYNNNDLFYLNSKNKSSIIEENFSKNRNSSYFINPKIEKIELAENNDNLDDFLNESFEEILLKQKGDKTDDNIISIPCTNCEKMININEIDDHSNKCYKINEEIKYNYSIQNYISIIDNKIKNLYFHISKIQNDRKYIQNDNIGFDEFFDLLTNLNQKIEEILGTKLVNSLSINKLSKINNNLNELMEKYYNSTNLFTLLSRINNLLEEKIKYFIEHNENNLNIVNNNIVKEDQEINNKNISKTMDNSFKNKNKEFHIHNDNSIDEEMSESETMELFDLKKMEKILDKKSELKAVNLDNFVNETKNKRLFMMEVLKVKYQKISNNKSEDLVQPEMIWEEAKKQKIKINEWPKFIFDELSDPNKYLKMIQKKKEKKKIKKNNI